jgi:hypothetical protein
LATFSSRRRAAAHDGSRHNPARISTPACFTLNHGESLRAAALLLLCAAICATLFAAYASTRAAAGGRGAAREAAEAQLPRAPAQRRTKPAPRGRDYSKFLHATEGHRERACDSCHRVASFERPDITDYPDHPSCVQCHRRQFFSGARPAICSNCHAVVSPRGEARLPFPKPRAPSQFADVFPHANHVRATSLLQFKRVIGEKANTQATCLYCHKVNRAEFKLAAGAPAGTFVPPPGTYMTTPTSHATCFQCHWREDVEGREQPPFASQCAGCHRNAVAALASAPRAAGTLTTTTTNAARVGARPPTTPGTSPRASDLSTHPGLAEPAFVLASASGAAGSRASVPPRVSPKFVHDIESHKRRQNEEGREVNITCLQCHAAARKAETLEALRASESRVQLLTCSSSACHTATSGTAQLALSVYRELRERGKDAKFDCALCHAPPLSLAADAPCDHYAAVLASATKEKKATRGIEQLTPPRCADAIKGEVK